MKTTIEFKGRDVEVEQVADYICKHVTKEGKGKTNYYLFDRVAGEWKYSHETRFNGLVKRFGSIEAVSERYLTPVAVQVIRATENHELAYLLDKQPGVTKKKTTAKKSKAKVKDAPVEVKETEPVNA